MNEIATESETAGGPATLLVFSLAGERFALPVAAVAEVIDPVPATPVPHAPTHAPTLVNVRGVITPVIDVRQRLQIPPATTSPPTARLVVIDIALSAVQQRLAINADAVETVLETDLSELEILPELGSRWPADLIQGACRDVSGVFFLLNAGTIFDPDHVAA